jgi:hypothetical protein
MNKKNFSDNEYSTSVAYSFVKCVRLDKEQLNISKRVLHYEGCKINKNMNTRRKRNMLLLRLVILKGKIVKSLSKSI